MKKIYTVFLMVLFLFILTPVHAKDTQNILITGKHLPYIMVARKMILWICTLFQHL